MNTARQPSTSTRRPPTAGPAIIPTPTVVMSSPIAFPRSSDGKEDVMMAIPVPWVIPAPHPCSSLARIRRGRLLDHPASTAPPTNTAMPAMYILFRPTRSDSLPMGSRRALMVRV